MGHYPNISAERVYANKPVTEDLLDDLRDSADYNFERGIRTGTDAVGVRLALARGAEELTYDGSGLDFQMGGTVTFEDDADDGDPGFSAAPNITFGCEEEVSGGYENWSVSDGIRSWSPLVVSVSTTGFTYRVQFENDADTQAHGYLHWVAIGEPQAGE